MKKISKSLINNPKISKKVNQYDLNGIFIKQWESIMEVERQLNINQKNVTKGKERKSEAFENLIEDINRFYKKRGKGIAKTRTKTIAQKVRLNLLLSKFKKSSFATSKKRKERGQKTRNTLTQKYGKKVANKSLAIFSTEAYHYFKEQGLFDSDQVKTMATEYEDIDEEILQKVFEEATVKMIISMCKAKEDEKCQIKWRFIISVPREEQKR